MSAQVDVVAVMRADDADAYSNRLCGGVDAAEYHRALSTAARAAVAELIEAAAAIKAVRGGTMALGAQDARSVRLWAALARVQGGAA